jgi:hypothetical protein
MKKSVLRELLKKRNEVKEVKPEIKEVKKSEEKKGKE